MKSKNAQFTVQALAGVAIALIVAALIVGIGARVLSTVQETSAATTKLINQTQTISGATNNTIYALTNAPPNKVITAEFQVWNDTGYTVAITSTGNWSLLTQRNAFNVLTPADAGLHHNWYIRYNMTFVQTYSYNASESGKVGADTLAGWIPTIALIIVAAILVGIVVSSFMLRRRGR